MDTNRIIQGDCVEVLKSLPNESVDLIFADPPYNLQLKKELKRPDNSKVNAVNDDWDKFSSFSEYDKFTYEWILECKRILKPNGTIWIIGSYHNIFRVGKTIQDLGFWILNDIIWRKSNPMPNFKGTRFTNAHENLIWASKSKKSKYTFNYQTMKYLNNNKQMRSDWLINVCGGRERLKDKNNDKVHNAQKPEELLERIVLSSTKVNDIVLDPFFGTGTTGVICKKLGRKFIGIERNPYYLNEAKTRILKVKKVQTKNIEKNSYDVQQKRIAFSYLLEKGIIKPGNKLYDAKKIVKATVLQNGSLKFKKDTGSIHKIGAIVQNKHACNGWNFWYIQHKNRLISINEHRTYLREEIKEKE